MRFNPSVRAIRDCRRKQLIWPDRATSVDFMLEDRTIPRLLIIQRHFGVSLLGEVSARRSRRDDEAIQRIVEEEQR